jgi:hypothetical protein
MLTFIVLQNSLADENGEGFTITRNRPRWAISQGLHV